MKNRHTQSVRAMRKYCDCELQWHDLCHAVVIFPTQRPRNCSDHENGIVSVIFFAYSINAFFGIACALLCKLEMDHPVTNKLLQNISQTAGQLSYSVFVLHLIVIELTRSWGFLAYVGATLLLSAIIYQNFEKPILLMRPRFRTN